MSERRPPQKNFKAGKDRIKLTKNLQQLQGALQQRISNAASCKVACQQLAESAFHKPEVQMMIGRLGLLEDIQEAMRRHEKSADLQEAACRALAAVAGHQGNHNKAAELLPEIKAAIVAHAGSAAVLEAACRAVSVIAGSPKSRDACASIKVLSAVQKCMRAHRANPGLQEAAFSAVSNVVLQTPAAQAQAERLGIREDISAGMKAHATAPKVLERGQVAIERCEAAAPDGPMPQEGDGECEDAEAGGGLGAPGGDNGGD